MGPKLRDPQGWGNSKGPQGSEILRGTQDSPYSEQGGKQLPGNQGLPSSSRGGGPLGRLRQCNIPSHPGSHPSPPRAAECPYCPSPNLQGKSVVLSQGGEVRPGWGWGSGGLALAPSRGNSRLQLQTAFRAAHSSDMQHLKSPLHLAPQLLASGYLALHLAQPSSGSQRTGPGETQCSLDEPLPDPSWPLGHSEPPFPRSLGAAPTVWLWWAAARAGRQGHRCQATAARRSTG